MHGKTEIKLKRIGLWTREKCNNLLCLFCHGKIIFPFIWPVILWKRFIPCSLIAFCALTKNKRFKQLIVPFMYRIDKKVGWSDWANKITDILKTDKRWKGENNVIFLIFFIFTDELVYQSRWAGWNIHYKVRMLLERLWTF